MSRHTSTITADGDTLIASVVKPRGANNWMATIYAYGTWGGGTITWKVSTDGGTTKIPMKTISGTSMTSNANDEFGTNRGNPGKNTETTNLYATMAGSSTPSVTVDVDDNT